MVRQFFQVRPSPRNRVRTGRQWCKEKTVCPLLATEGIAPFCLPFPRAELGEGMGGEEVGRTSAVSHRQKHMNQDEKEKGSFFKFLRARAPEGPIFHRSRMRSLDRSLPCA